MTRFRAQRKRLASPGDVGTLKQTVQLLWQVPVTNTIIASMLVLLFFFLIKLAVCGQEVLGLSKDATVDEDSNFLLSGGDSLKALHLCEDLLAAAGAAPAGLLEVVLDGTFSDVLSHVTRAAAPESRPLSPSGGVKRHAGVAPAPAAPPKRERKQEGWAGKVLRRAGEEVDINVPKTAVPDDAIAHSSGRGGLDLRLSWSSDTGRCVDASPVLLVRYTTDQGPDEGKPTVIIGSHSHRVQALDLISGSLVWERVLGGRVEASAAVSRCGSLVVVGQFLRLTLGLRSSRRSRLTEDFLLRLLLRLLRQLRVFLVCLIWRHTVGFQDGGCSEEQPSSGSSHGSGHRGVT